MLAKQKIKESFSRAALTYNEASDFQKETGRMLIDKILSDAAPRDKILDVGMGTGRITQQLAIRAGKHIYGCDMAWGMVSFARTNTNGIFITQADIEELPFKQEAFDAVFSNIAYQWVTDFTKAFLELKRVLKEEGRFYFSILIKDSLRELYDVLEAVLKMDCYKNFLPGAEFIQTQLERCDFKIEWCEEQIIRRYYESSLDLIRTFKKNRREQGIGD